MESAENSGNQAHQNLSSTNYRSFIMKASNNSNSGGYSALTPERSSTPSFTNKCQTATSSTDTTPKMGIPLWISLQSELLKAPKKSMKMLRRSSTSSPSTPYSSVNATNGRARSRICKDLFGVKTDVQIQQVRG